MSGHISRSIEIIAMKYYHEEQKYTFFEIKVRICCKIEDKNLSISLYGGHFYLVRTINVYKIIIITYTQNR